MDVDELELYMMPAVQQAIQKTVEVREKVEHSLKKNSTRQ